MKLSPIRGPSSRPSSPIHFRVAAALTLATFPWLFSPPAATAMPNTPPSQAGEAVWPLRPRPEVVRGFEQPAKPWLPGHRGLDLAGSPGQPILSATAGTITYAGQLAGRGVIVVSSGRIRTSYEPVVASLTVGTAVEPGDQIGRLSAAGSHCSPASCLHWGLLEAEQYLDPLSLLPSQPVRLLPLNPVPTNATPQTNAERPAAPGLAGHPEPLARAFDGQATGPSADQAGATQASGRQLTVDRASPGQAEVPQAAEGRGGGAVAGLVVGLAAAATVIGGLLIRRH